jgi:polyisoprenoid-binding protein YceI
MRSRILSVFAIVVAFAGAAALIHARAEEADSFPQPADGQAIYDVDPVHTSVVFHIAHAQLNDVYGFFTEKSGQVLVDEAHPENSYVEFTVNMASVNTGVDKRDNDVRSDHYLNVDKFATATFKSTSVTKTGDQQLQIDGVLTFMGISKPLSVSMDINGPKDSKQGRSFGFSTSFSIKRSDFGAAVSPGLGDEVFLTLSGAAKMRQPGDDGQS